MTTRGLRAEHVTQIAASHHAKDWVVVISTLVALIWAAQQIFLVWWDRWKTRRPQ